MNTERASEWKGSTRTAAMVAQEIAQRWGSDEVKNYDPMVNCFTYKRWQKEGYQVKKGEKAIRSVTWISASGDENDEHARRFPKTVCLFYIKQVELTKKAASANQFLNSPVAHVSADIADAFGMRGLPNTVVHEAGPGVVAMEFGFSQEGK